VGEGEGRGLEKEKYSASVLAPKNIHLRSGSCRKECYTDKKIGKTS